jgi:hypothetical protein
VEPQDELVKRIASYVASQVPPDLREVVTRATCVTLAAMMADPYFVGELAVVKQLRSENEYIRTQYLILKQMMSQVGVATPRKKAAPRKRAAGSSSRPASKARPSGSATKRAPNSSFRQGFEEMRG